MTVVISDHDSAGTMATNSLKLLPGGAEVEVRCFVGVTFVECYFQGARAMLTAPIEDQNYCHFASKPPPRFEGFAVFAVFADSAATLTASVWGVGGIWVSA